MKVFVATFLLMVSSLSLGAECRASGEFRKSGQPDDTLVISAIDGELQLQLSASGQTMPDGTRTSGAVKGPLMMSDGGCVAAYVNSDEECALFLIFGASTVKVHQFGSCLFGAGAWGGGEYKRFKSRA